MPRIPVTVLTGFLGAGKTTIVNAILNRAHGRRIGVVVNEFGDEGVDGALIAGGQAEALVELSNGCVCCRVADDFLPTIEQLVAHQPPLDAIVIETSGLALPQPLLKAFDWPGVRERATIDAVVTVVDATALAEGRIDWSPDEDHDEPADHDDPVEEVFEDQLVCADLVILSKTDLVAPDQARDVRNLVARGVRPGVEVMPAVAGEVPLDVLLGLTKAAESDRASRQGHHAEGEEHDHDDFESVVLTNQRFASLDGARSAVERLLAVPGVLRAKGHVAVDGKAAPVLVQGVGRRADVRFARPEERISGGLVVIGLDPLDRAAVTAAVRG